MGYASYSEGYNAGVLNAYTPPFFPTGFVLPIELDIGLTPEEKAWLKAHPKIVLGLDSAWKTAARVE